MDTATVTLPTSETITGRIVFRCWLRGIRAVPTDDGVQLEPAGLLPPVEAAWLEQHGSETLTAQAALGALGVAPSVSDDPAVAAAIATYQADRAVMVAIADEYGAAKTAELKAAAWWLGQLIQAEDPTAVAAEIPAARNRVWRLCDELGVTLSERAIAAALALDSHGG